MKVHGGEYKVSTQLAQGGGGTGGRPGDWGFKGDQVKRSKQRSRARENFPAVVFLLAREQIQDGQKRPKTSGFGLT